MPDFTKNPEQRTAINHGAGPMLVLAGPGSGKTFVITHRIRHLISECRIPPNNILVLTFTKAAALEMQNRANQLLSQSSYVRFGTFHSLFYEILRTSDQFKHVSPASDKERFFVVGEMLKVKTGEARTTAEMAENCLKEFSYYKNTMQKDFTFSCKEYEEIYKLYQEWLKDANKMDFDDMVEKCYRYLRNNPKERMQWQRKFPYILIDEFQDINGLQYETIKLLCGNGNLFVVGDDDQAIYGFRGSDPGIMLRFLEEYGAKQIVLPYNYRCSKQIAEASGRFIENNKNRLHKNIRAAKKIKGEVLLIKTNGREEQAAYIKDEVVAYAEKYPEKSQAVLTRTNGLFGIYRAFLGMETKNPFWPDIKAYLNFINAGMKRSDFLQIMNKPNRYISRNLLLESCIDFGKLKKRLEDKPWIRERVSEFENQVRFVSNLDLCGQIRFVWKSMGYERYQKEENAKDRLNEESRELFFSDILKNARGETNLTTFIENMEKNTEKKVYPVQIMTYHGAKGLEFDRVYLPDLNFGKTPHGRMFTEPELEEERRMFYVAMTRAKESLVLLCDKKQTISPFLTEFYASSDASTNSSNSQLSRYSSNASSTFSNSASLSI